MVEKGEIPVLRIGRNVRILRRDLERWIEERREDCTHFAPKAEW